MPQDIENCVSQMHGKVDNEYAFCNWAKQHGKGPYAKGGATKKAITEAVKEYTSTRKRKTSESCQRKQRKNTVSLREDIVRGFRSLPEGTPRVDREVGLIRGVRILGLQSQNGRRYTPEAIQDAVDIYEGMTVNVDHPKKPNDSRSAYDRVGKLVNVQHASDGLYGDLQVLKSHPLAERLMEAAERMPEAFALSHNADGKGHTESDGTFVVEAITEVRSVDIVADGATNKSLFESKTMKTTLRELVEAITSEHKVQLIKALEEVGDEYAEMPMDMPAEPAPAETGGDWKQDLVAAIGKLVASEAPEDHDMARKIMNMLKPAAAEVATEEQDEGDGEEEKKDDEEEKMEARKAKKSAADATVKHLQEEIAVRDLIEEAGLKFATSDGRKAFAKSLILLAPEERQVLIEERAASQKQAQEKTRTPVRSSSPSNQNTADFELNYRNLFRRVTGRMPDSAMRK